MARHVMDEIEQEIAENKVVLYMKGSPQFPMCGFSATASQLLKAAGAQEVYTVEVLQNRDIRVGI